ncbi:MAG: methyltransferase domain-containing protein [Hyphomicrobiales bacterium]
MSKPSVRERMNVLQSFKRSLKDYHQNAVVQAEIAKTLIDHFLTTSQRENYSHVLEFGCATGHLSEQLISRLKIDAFTANDLIEESQQYIAPKLNQLTSNWRFIAGAIEEIDLPENLDLVASSSTVQWIFDTATLLEKLTGMLAPNGWLALSSFTDNHFTELQVMGSKAKAPRYTNVEDWPSLMPHNVAIKHIHTEEIKIHFPTVHAMLSHLRQTGVNGNAGQAWGRQKLLEFESVYEKQFKDDEGIFLTYAPIYIIAQKQS